MKIGYIRISTTDQNTARQEVLMEELGVGQVFIDRMSGKSTDRPELKRMMTFVREGDVVIVMGAGDIDRIFAEFSQKHFTL